MGLPIDSDEITFLVKSRFEIFMWDLKIDYCNEGLDVSNLPTCIIILAAELIMQFRGMLNNVPVGVTKGGFKLGETGHKILDDDAVMFSDMMKDVLETARGWIFVS